jgi:hypothetical protein
LAPPETAEVAKADPMADLPDWQYVGYKVAHHVGVTVKHIKEFGLNKFDHPRIADHTSFVTTPSLDHFYSKAAADLRAGPVVVTTPPRDERYSSIQVFDLEHHTIFDDVTGPKAQRYVIAHVDHKGKLPKGKVIKSHSKFPFVFLRTQSFKFNNDKKADGIRRKAKLEGKTSDIELPDPEDPSAVLAWAIAHSKPYPQTLKLMTKAAEDYTAEVHKQTFESLKAFLAAGGVSGSVGMFEAVDDTAGGSHKIRAAGTLLAHLGFPVHHAYYQQIPVDSKGTKLAGKNGPFLLELPYDPGVKLFWSVTRYGADTFLPLDPATIGGNDIQAYNALNTKPDTNGKVKFTFSMNDPKDGTYWMPVTEAGYYVLVRYYGPTAKLNGMTAKDFIYGGTPLEKRFTTVRF